jgi:hypothetical protein
MAKIGARFRKRQMGTRPFSGTPAAGCLPCSSGFRALGAPPIFGVGDPLRNPEDDPLGTPSVDLFGTRLGYVTGAATETSPVTFRGDVLIVFVKVFDIRGCRRAMSRPVSPPN